MQHAWAYLGESKDGNDHQFRCPNCKQVVGFNKPGIGEPSATPDAMPADIDRYASPCLPDADPVTEAAQKIDTMLKVVAHGADPEALLAAGVINDKDRSILIDAKTRASLAADEAVTKS